VVGENDNLLPGVNFRLQVNIICLVVIPGPIKVRHASLFNKKRKCKYIKYIKLKNNFFFLKKKKFGAASPPFFKNIYIHFLLKSNTRHVFIGFDT
jgi:hypothetical protein